MQRLILLALLPAILTPVAARAESPTQLLCAPAEREWAKVRNGGDLAAMDRVIGQIGPRCSAVLGANARRAAVERELARRASPPRLTNVKAIESAEPTVGPGGTAAQAFSQGEAAYNAKDYAQAMTWYQAAAADGSAAAQNRIGVLYQNGWGVPEEDAQAMAWFQKAAARGNAQAQTNIGFMYEHGWGVPQDNAQARSWYEKAAAAGDADAKEWLAKNPH